jgi:hypothetical protein
MIVFFLIYMQNSSKITYVIEENLEEFISKVVNMHMMLIMETESGQFSSKHSKQNLIPKKKNPITGSIMEHFENDHDNIPEDEEAMIDRPMVSDKFDPDTHLQELKDNF